MNLRYTSNFFYFCTLPYNLFKSVENIVMTLIRAQLVYALLIGVQSTYSYKPIKHKPIKWHHHRPSMVRKNSIIRLILLKGLTMVNCMSCSAPLAVKNETKIQLKLVWYTCVVRNIQIDGKVHSHKSTSKSIAWHGHKTTFASQLDKKCKGRNIIWGHIQWDPNIIW